MLVTTVAPLLPLDPAELEPDALAVEPALELVDDPVERPELALPVLTDDEPVLPLTPEEVELALLEAGVDLLQPRATSDVRASAARKGEDG
jgi:hypothetical protein